MGQFQVNQKDIFFILKEQLGYGSLCSLDGYRDLDETALDLVVGEALKFARGVVDPLNRIGDREGVRFDQGRVFCPEPFRTAFAQYGHKGWIATVRDPEYGGGGFPRMMRIVVNDLMYGACQAFNMAPSLTHGAAHLIESFGTETLRETFVREMYAGRWSGTMALTEPQAGSNLGAIETRAVPGDDGYLIQGSKVFISWGEHDLTENIVHLTLARIEGAPEGTRGISLFVIPKFRVRPDGSPGEFNSVTCSGIEEKLGLHASPTCTLNFGENGHCLGYLCGLENRGLAHMFQMMNQARINTAVSGMSIAGTAYRNALAYCRSRRQGRDLSGEREGQVPLITHPDVRRMLLWMKGVVDGMRSMVYTTAFWSDLANGLQHEAKREHYQNLVEFSTPMLKAYCSETGFRVCETAIQCLGGYGYCRDYPLEQYLRDVKIMSLYEGTNGIQSLDLMGRKLKLKDGALLESFLAELEGFCARNLNHPVLGDRVRVLSGASARIRELCLEMTNREQTDVLFWGANTYPALLGLSRVFLVWRLLDMGIVAADSLKKAGKSRKEFYQAKVLQAGYFTTWSLPRALVEMQCCLQSGREVLTMPQGAF